MKVHVQFYSLQRDLAGTHPFDVDLDEKATVANLLEKVYQKATALRSHDKSILVGAGVEFVDRNYTIKPGDEISIMPPVQGG
jgi:molybdopterin converting factor small subunit